MPARPPDKPALRSIRLRAALVAATAAVVLLAAAPPAAAQARATLRGTLRNAAGGPLPNVTINVFNFQNENERQVITEADGTWTMGGLLPGRYEIRIDETGFASFRQTVTLTAGQDSTQNLTLRTAAAAPSAPTPPQPTPPATPTPTPSQQPTPRATAPPAVVVPDYVPSPDRWRLEFPVWQRYPPDVPGHHPYTDGRKLDPYNRNVLKGDYPAFGSQDVFVVLTGVVDVPFEYRRVPTPSGVSQARPGSDD